MNDQPTPETERIKGALHTNWNDLMNHARKLERERDEAWEVLQEIEAARWHTACELRRLATQALGNLTIPTK